MSISAIALAKMFKATSGEITTVVKSDSFQEFEKRGYLKFKDEEDFLRLSLTNKGQLFFESVMEKSAKGLSLDEIQILLEVSSLISRPRKSKVRIFESLNEKGLIFLFPRKDLDKYNISSKGRDLVSQLLEDSKSKLMLH